MIYKYYNDLQQDKYNIAYYSCRNLAAAAAYREHLDRVDKMCNHEFHQLQNNLGCLKHVRKMVDTYSGGQTECVRDKGVQMDSGTGQVTMNPGRRQQRRRSEKNVCTTFYSGATKRGGNNDGVLRHQDYDYDGNYGCRIVSSDVSVAGGSISSYNDM